MGFIKKHITPILIGLGLLTVVGACVYFKKVENDRYLKITGFTYFEETFNIYTVREDILIPNDCKISVDGEDLTTDDFYYKLSNDSYLVMEKNGKFFAKKDTNAPKSEEAPVDMKTREVKTFKEGDTYIIDLPDFDMNFSYLSINAEQDGFKLSNTKLEKHENYELKKGTNIKITTKKNLIPLLADIAYAIQAEVK